jgi:LysR family transcriptional regulator, glycine cleavage system transcriptional activator
MRLPPLTSLRFFEAAARQGSFRLAASELHVSNGTVSYHIQTLERFFGKPLFIRKVRCVELTHDGHLLSSVLASVLPPLAAVTTAISRVASPDRLRVQVGPYFSAHWLMPRLDGFRSLHPNIDLVLQHATSRGLEVSDAPFDLSISWGHGQWRGFEATHLLAVRAVPVCSATYMRRHPGLAKLIAAGSSRVTFLHYEGDDAWSEWFAAVGSRHPQLRADIKFDDPNVLNEAAADGQGVAIGFWPLVQRDVVTGRLRIAHPLRAACSSGYFLVVRQGKKLPASAAHFRAWLTGQVEACSS